MSGDISTRQLTEQNWMKSDSAPEGCNFLCAFKAATMVHCDVFVKGMNETTTTFIVQPSGRNSTEFTINNHGEIVNEDRSANPYRRAVVMAGWKKLKEDA